MGIIYTPTSTGYCWKAVLGDVNLLLFPVCPVQAEQALGAREESHLSGLRESCQRPRKWWGWVEVGREGTASAMCAAWYVWQASPLAGGSLSFQTCGPPSPPPFSPAPQMLLEQVSEGGCGRACHVCTWTCGMVPASGPEVLEGRWLPEELWMAGSWEERTQEVAYICWAGERQCTLSRGLRGCCGRELRLCRIGRSARKRDPRGVTVGQKLLEHHKLQAREWVISLSREWCCIRGPKWRQGEPSLSELFFFSSLSQFELESLTIINRILAVTSSFKFIFLLKWNLWFILKCTWYDVSKSESLGCSAPMKGKWQDWASSQFAVMSNCFSSIENYDSVVLCWD